MVLRRLSDYPRHLKMYGFERVPSPWRSQTASTVAEHRSFGESIFDGLCSWEDCGNEVDLGRGTCPLGPGGTGVAEQARTRAGKQWSRAVFVAMR